MSALFFFGTLRHLPLLEVVSGQALDTMQLREATLPGYAVTQAVDGPFPVITAETGAVAGGLCAEGLTPQAVARLDFYEAAFDYHLETLSLADGSQAQVYLPPDGRWQGQGGFDLDAWVRDWAPISIAAAQEVLLHRGHRTPAEVGAMFAQIRTRAAARVNAQNPQHGAGLLNGAVDVLEQRPRYANFFALDEYTLRHDRFGGGQSPALERAVFKAADAAIVLPYDAVRDRVLLVEQFRLGPFGRGDPHCWQLEPIAGRVDAGETPQACALREAQEEAGLHLTDLREVAQVYCSPGNSTEFYFIYLGLCDLPDDAAGLGGLDTEDEDIRAHLMSYDALMDLCDTQQAANAPLVLVANWLARHREELRTAPKDA